MKRALFITLLMLLVGINAFAGDPDRVGRWEAGILGGGAFNSDFEDAGYVQANVAYGVTPYIALGMEAGWQEGEGTGNEENIGIVPVLADIILRSPDWHDQMVPYAVLGLGMVGVYVTDEDGTNPLNNGDDVDDVTFGYKIGAGIDWFLNENWVAIFEIAFFGSSPDIEGSSIKDTDFWMIGAGLKYAF